MMNEKATKFCLSKEGINNIVLVARFIAKKCRVLVLLVDATVEVTDGDNCDSDDCKPKTGKINRRYKGI